MLNAQLTGRIQASEPRRSSGEDGRTGSRQEPYIQVLTVRETACCS